MAPVEDWCLHSYCLQTDSAILLPVRSDEKADWADMRLNRLRHDQNKEATLKLALVLA